MSEIAASSVLSRKNRAEFPAAAGGEYRCTYWYQANNAGPLQPFLLLRRFVVHLFDRVGIDLQIGNQLEGARHPFGFFPQHHSLTAPKDFHCLAVA